MKLNYVPLRGSYELDNIYDADATLIIIHVDYLTEGDSLNDKSSVTVIRSPLYIHESKGK